MKVAVLFDRFGPYHLARLGAASAHLDITGIETFHQDDVYAWNLVEQPESERLRLLSLYTKVQGTLDPNDLRRRLAAELDRTGPNAVAIPGWASLTALVALEWCARNSVPAIVMSDTNKWDYKRHFFREIPKKMLISRYSAALVAGSSHTDYLEELGMEKKRIFMGYDVVDNLHFKPVDDAEPSKTESLRKELGLPDRYFLASARFIEKKNLEFLLRAFAAYRERAGKEAFSLVLLGDGPLREKIEAERRRLRLETSVFLPGFKQYEELPSFYHLAEAFVHASTREQWGLVINEAMASGLPIILSKSAGCVAELLDENRNGFTFDPQSLEDLISKLSEMHADDARRLAMGRSSLEIIKDWGPERFATGLEKALDAANSRPLPHASPIGSLLLRSLISRHSALELYDPN